MMISLFSVLWFKLFLNLDSVFRVSRKIKLGERGCLLIVYSSSCNVLGLSPAALPNHSDLQRSLFMRDPLLPVVQLTVRV